MSRLLALWPLGVVFVLWVPLLVVQAAASAVLADVARVLGSISGG